MTVLYSGNLPLSKTCPDGGIWLDGGSRCSQITHDNTQTCATPSRPDQRPAPACFFFSDGDRACGKHRWHAESTYKRIQLNPQPQLEAPSPPPSCRQSASETLLSSSQRTVPMKEKFWMNKVVALVTNHHCVLTSSQNRKRWWIDSKNRTFRRTSRTESLCNSCSGCRVHCASFQSYQSRALSKPCRRRYIIYMLSDRTTPLFVIFRPSPEAGQANAPLDMSGILAYIAILIHVNLSLIVHPWNVVVAGRVIRAIGFLETFAWSAAAPLLSVYSGRVWQTTVWWCIPGFMTYVVYAVHGWIRKADEDVSELERLKYRAPGA